MVFRAGVDGDTGCYAWLSYVEAWGLVPGATLGTAERRGDRDVITFPNGVEVHLIDGGAAEHHSQNGVTPGQLR